MKVKNYSKVEATEEAPGVLQRIVIGTGDGAPRFVMRVFEVAPGSSTPFHSHWWEHEVYILSGAGVVKEKDRENPIGEGSVVFVTPDEEHCFVNTGTDALRFICVIPKLET
jgi:quercetin dioxygenase-like cupin family protein